MIKLGEVNNLEILRETSVGFFLGKDDEEVLLPRKYTPKGVDVGDNIDVFVYQDSEDRIIATTLEPNIKIGEFALMKVIDVNAIGAFLDWGLEKDLFVPFREQTAKMKKDGWYLVTLYVDERTNRLVGSAKIDRFLEHENIELEPDQEVDLMVINQTDLGFNCIIDGKYKGLIFKDEVFKTLSPGDKIKGFVKQVREDKKIDLSLQKSVLESIEPNAQFILDYLNSNEGFTAINDKSSPEIIYDVFEMSKKNFKRAVGNLYKKKLISIEPDGIRLLASD